jgi:hypothetical protein
LSDAKPKLEQFAVDARRAQSKLSILICRISVRSSNSICGRPPRERDFHRQWRRKPARCHRTSVSGWTIVTTFKIVRNHRYIQTKNQRSLFVSRARPFTTQDDQLMSENRILRLKPALRLEWRGQHGKNNPDQRDHRANLSDSIVQ